MTRGMKVAFWIIYTLSLIGAAFLINEGFYMWRFWAWVLG